MRTTLNIDDPILKQLRRLRERDGKSMGRLVSDLLAQSLASHHAPTRRPPVLKWITQPMDARIDVSDRHTVLDAMGDVRP